MGKEKELTRYKADLFEDLRDPEYAALYLNGAEESESHEELLLALRDVAEAHKMSVVAEASNLNRENLYKMLSESGNPRLTSFRSVLNSLGIGLGFIALKADKATPPPRTPSRTETETTARPQGQHNPTFGDTKIRFATANANTSDVTLLGPNGYNPTFVPANFSSGSANQMTPSILPATPSANSYSPTWWNTTASQPGLQDRP
jgi:probable addiction module antidote protein